MYPCTNPELVAAVSDAGAIGVVQPVSMTYVYGHDFRAGLRLIKSATPRPFGMNALIEQSSKSYRERVERWVDIALEEGVRFFVTSLGNPRWVVDKAAQVGGIVYHDVTERKWAAEGDPGRRPRPDRRQQRRRRTRRPTARQRPSSTTSRASACPVICAGGVGDPATFRRMMDLGYAGVQMGTRFIATAECRAHADYKQAIVDADAGGHRPHRAADRAARRRHQQRLHPAPRNPRRSDRPLHAPAPQDEVLDAKHLRAPLAPTASRRPRSAPPGANDYWQAGKSVVGIHSVESAAPGRPRVRRRPAKP